MVAAAASRGPSAVEAPIESRQNRVRSAASASSERSADRSLDGLEPEDEAAATAGSPKKDKKKEKNKSGLLKGLFGSKKNKVGLKEDGVRL